MTADPFQLMDDWGPEKIVVVSDRRSGMRGVLVLDNTARGMGKGGTRMAADLSVHEVARLARTMTWKWAACDLFHGGAKAGIQGDPNSPDKERILRAFARALAAEVPSEYVFGLDMGLSETDAAIFVDELNDRGAAVGLPSSLGGLPYDELGITGYGVAEATDASTNALGWETAGSRVAIQGFGAVGQAAAQRLGELGARITAVSTARGAILDEDGLDVAKLVELKDAYGDDCVVAYGGRHEADALLDAAVDILIPAAREDVVGTQVARATTARLVVEGANLPTTREARAILHARGVAVVPDFIANAGGIIAAAHSMDARTSPFPVDRSEVFTMVSSKIRSNATLIAHESRRSGAPPHEVARAIAQDRVRRAMQARGQIAPSALATPSPSPSPSTCPSPSPSPSPSTVADLERHGVSPEGKTC
ncbi:Glu/Leu/Phe/Val family dehydrogenase [Nocardioides acrostichi]|uniref:Glutamate dehydrogenase n=1 Tax=Nocardioides acrostichi TaxID=2784339 RepID=A0A930UW44_9ACTN|nr:Glu/Leu/Phe/Val dehydrogenase [Nocardioides acrostichi]MBF4160737.1 Glu/Leu/Phe/Val dehydrogenase [Nocardioides acrostichi]